MAYLTDTELEIVKSALTSHDETFRYHLLSRLKSDCDYVLNMINERAEETGFAELPMNERIEIASRNLWAGNPTAQVAAMKALWNSFEAEKKPEWLTPVEIRNYADQLRCPLFECVPDLAGSTAKAVLYPVMHAPIEVYVSNDHDISLKELQALVEGYIEPLDVLGNGIGMYINEDGLGTLDVNRAVYANESLHQDGYLSQLDFSHVPEPGELYTLVSGPLLTVFYEKTDWGYDADTLVDPSPDQLAELGKTIGDEVSGLREGLLLRADIDLPYMSLKEKQAVVEEVVAAEKLKYETKHDEQNHAAEER